ncbi:MAG: T9SS type A sorting domain-containing protein, partial [Bacteroidales bacterium]
LAQITFEAEDYPEVGDTYQKIKYFNNPGDEPAFLSSFESGENYVFDTVGDFVDYSQDSVLFLNPVQHDTAGIFPNATHLMRQGNQDIYINKTDQAALAIGFAGDMFEMDMEIPMVADSALKLMEFPTTEQTAFTDDTYSEETMPVEDLEHVIPPDYYDDFASYFDSVKIMLSVEIETEISGEAEIEVTDIPHAVGGTYNCLQENSRQVRGIDVHGRSIMTGEWVPLGDAFGDMLPMDLPIIDTTHNINFWTPEFAIPFVQLETSANHDTVHSASFHYTEESGINSKKLLTLNIYPNPASSKVSVNLGDDYNDVTYLEIRNIQGKVVKKLEVNTKFFTFATSDLPNGWYLINALNNNGAITAKQKLMIIK